MSALSGPQQSLHRLDELARADSPVHRLDARAKVAATLVFAAVVVSLGKHEVAGLLPFSLYPVCLAAAAGLPPGFLVRQAVPALPFVVLVAALNPLFDTRPMLSVGGVVLSGGWVSFGSIALRGLLTVFAALVLVATTGIDGTVRTLAGTRFRATDGLFMLGCAAACAALRLWPLPPLLEHLVQEVLR